ncbi:MAG: barstar family protein [Niabella sp.]
MQPITFDFDRISSIEDFYKFAQSALNLPEHFGNNLDALWDCLTGDIALPMEVHFVNLTMNQLERFDNLITLFEDASTETNGGILFEYYLKKD